MYLYAKQVNWIGRIDHPEDVLTYRWHQVIQYKDLSPEVLQSDNSNNSEKDILFLGFCCDEGVKRNNGRPGARNGPEAIRKQLMSLPFHWPDKISIHEGGNIMCDQNEMEIAQQLLANTLKKALTSNYFPIVLGGGHEMAWGSFKGLYSFLKYPQNIALPKIGIINFDAHFDLRDFSQTTSSGTPFTQIGNLCKKESVPFNYLCLGIQKMGNTQRLFETAKQLEVDYILADDFHINNFQTVKQVIEKFIQKCDILYVTIDLDGFQNSIAPGVSAPSPLGFAPEMVLNCLEVIIQSGKLNLLDLAELNPDFDIDNKTAKLAAALTFKIIDHLAGI
ncbi:formimidoylglutamase [Flexithrix dorotheae]|uniref:formimidoylglutamase n=1 Tax=Flexithrix dorotheae TaxID=70993 RepID=UPI000363BBE5|nr:formimidoylglutamase [Flexithrix dorotheae]